MVRGGSADRADAALYDSLIASTASRHENTSSAASGETKQVSSFSAADARPTDASLDFAHADHQALREIEDECIREAVARQEAAGLDCVTDGEFRRVFFMGSFDQAVRGFAPNHEQGETLEVEGRPIVAERLEKIASPGATEAEFVAGLTERPVKVTFPAASSIANPMLFRPGVTDKHYASFEEMAGHALQILRELIDDAIAAGATYIQLDYPAYPLIADPQFSAQMKAMGADLDQMLEGAAMADRMIVQGLPDHVRTAIHLCRGNLRGMYMVSGSLDPVAEAFFSLPYDSFLVEWDDTARMGDYSALPYVPKGPVVGMGIGAVPRERAARPVPAVRLRLRGGRQRRGRGHAVAQARAGGTGGGPRVGQCLNLYLLPCA
jgi:5-methyltetrahydropteroyltriglutamate--homocysteine methyltransferase